MAQWQSIQRFLAEPGMVWLVSTILVATVISILAIIVANVIRQHAAFSHRLLLVSLLMVVASPVICAWTPKVPMFWLDVTEVANGSKPSTADPHRFENKPSTVNVGSSFESNARDGGQQAQESTNDAIAESGNVPNVSSGKRSNSSTAVAPIEWISPLTFVLSLWAAGSLILTGRLAFQFYVLHRIPKSLVDGKHVALNRAFLQACQKLGMTEKPKLFSASIAAPIALSVPKAQVIVPHSLLDSNHASRSLLRRVLIHELAHIKRGDQFVLIIQRIIGALAWPFFPIHILNRSINRTREDICDNHVLALESRTEFCRDLLFMTDDIAGKNATPKLATGLIAARKLEHRVSDLLSETRSLNCRVSRAKSSSIVMAVSTLCVGLAAIGVGFSRMEPEDSHYVSETDDENFQPLLRSVELLGEKPDDVEVSSEIGLDGARFTQLRYGSSASDRIAVMMVTSPAGTEELYLDRNRDRRIDASEKIPKSGEGWRCDLQSQVTADRAHEEHRFMRQAVFKSSRFGVRIHFATVGFVANEIEIDGKQVNVRRQDTNGNGLFNDRDDRLWLDLNGDDRWDIDEQFPFRPILIIADNRYALSVGTTTDELHLKKVDSFGQIQLTPKLADPHADISHLRVTFSGRDGSIFTVDGTQAVTVPTGEYSIVNVSIVVDATERDPARSFVFTSRGALDTPRIFTVKKDVQSEIDPIGKLNFMSGAGVGEPPSLAVHAWLRLYTEDGLAITHSDIYVRSGSLHSGRVNMVKSRFLDDTENPVGACMTGFY